MRVLLTNNSLDARAGSELYVRDLAIELLRRGHYPVAYSTRLGQVAQELRNATVPVVSRLAMLGEPPDIIHGHHHYETLSAMLHFPKTPAISYCHGWLPWEEAPLRFPRILRYVAVDDVCRERLIAEGGIKPGKVNVLYNFFDAALFPPRTALPQRPLLALAFSNFFSDSADLPVLREACRRHGMELHAAGVAVGKSESNTGAMLAKYDVVFAKARAAIEAMAVGAAVVVCNPGRLGSMVTTRNLPALRRLNFGIRTMDRSLDVDAVTAELHEYDAADALAVSRSVRETSELRPAVDRILNLYEEVIEESRKNPVRVSTAGDRAAARYLEESAPQYKQSEIALDRQRWVERFIAAETALMSRKEEAAQVAADRSRWVSRCLAAERNLADSTELLATSLKEMETASETSAKVIARCKQDLEILQRERDLLRDSSWAVKESDAELEARSLEV